MVKRIHKRIAILGGSTTSDIKLYNRKSKRYFLDNWRKNMHDKLIIIGASGHGKVVADVAMHMKKYSSIAFLDDDESLKESLGIPVLGKTINAIDYMRTADLFVAIGNAEKRKKIQDNLEKQGVLFTVLIHPNAIIGTNVHISAGTVIMAGGIVNSDARIGRGCIINTNSSVDHDCSLADFVHVSIGAHIAGGVTIGESTWIGAGATVSNNVKICSSCMIGAGAVVIHDIGEKGTYVGVPVRKKEKWE